MLTILDRLEEKQPFSDAEAWTLFKVAAFGEAFGWTLLISGLGIKRYLTPGNNTPVLIAGRMHGVFFLVYLVAALGLYTSLSWSRKRTIVAAIASVPPYGSLVFEQWAAHRRKQQNMKRYREVTVRAIVTKGGNILAIKPRHSGYYFLPGGMVEIDETAEQALIRHLENQTGKSFELKHLVYVFQHKHKSVEKLELFFYAISKAKDFTPNPSEVDELEYVKPKNTSNLQPKFLQTESLKEVSKSKQVKLVNA